MTEEQQDQRIEHYEMLYIISANYTADEVKPIIEKIVATIKEQNGEITKDEDMGKIKFAYPIKQQNHGYYRLFEFNLPKEKLQNLNKTLSLANEILRFLLVKKRVKTETEIKKEKELQGKLAKKKEKEIEKIKAEKKEVKEKAPKEKGREKISLEDLDKKLDEILDTNKF